MCVCLRTITKSSWWTTKVYVAQRITANVCQAKALVILVKRIIRHRFKGLALPTNWPLTIYPLHLHVVARNAWARQTEQQIEMVLMLWRCFRPLSTHLDYQKVLHFQFSSLIIIISVKSRLQFIVRCWHIGPGSRHTQTNARGLSCTHIFHGSLFVYWFQTDVVQSEGTILLWIPRVSFGYGHRAHVSRVLGIIIISCNARQPISKTKI